MLPWRPCSGGPPFGDASWREGACGYYRPRFDESRMTALAVLVIILLVVAGFLLDRATTAARDRLDHWLERKRLGSLTLVAMGALFYFLSEDRYNRGLGVLIGIFGLIGLVLERSSALDRFEFDHLYLSLMLFLATLAVWEIATLPLPALWWRLAYTVAALVALLMLQRSTKRRIAAGAARFEQWARDMEARLAAPERHQFGPNSPRVEAFLAALNRMTPGKWDSVLSREEPAVGAVRALQQAGRAQERANATAVISEQLNEDYRHGYTASLAAEALVVRDLISEQDFAALYAPFEPLIPVAVLG